MQPIFHLISFEFDEDTAESAANGDRSWPGESTSHGQNVETSQISIGHEHLHTIVGVFAVGF